VRHVPASSPFLCARGERCLTRKEQKNREMNGMQGVVVSRLASSESGEIGAMKNGPVWSSEYGM
jgi:hypothetical protein